MMRKNPSTAWTGRLWKNEGSFFSVQICLIDQEKIMPEVET